MNSVRLLVTKDGFLLHSSSETWTSLTGSPALCATNISLDVNMITACV